MLHKTVTLILLQLQMQLAHLLRVGLTGKRANKRENYKTNDDMIWCPTICAPDPPVTPQIGQPGLLLKTHSKAFIHSLSIVMRINSPCVPWAPWNRITSSPFLMSVLVPDWAAMSDYVPVFPVGRCSPPVWPLIVASEPGIMTSCGVYTHGSTMNNNNISGAHDSRPDHH